MMRGTFAKHPDKNEMLGCSEGRLYQADGEQDVIFISDGHQENAPAAVSSGGNTGSRHRDWAARHCSAWAQAVIAEELERIPPVEPFAMVSVPFEIHQRTPTKAC